MADVGVGDVGDVCEVGTNDADAEPGPVGRTADVGWEIDVSRTVEAPAEAVWQWLVSDAGQQVWLGPGARAEPRLSGAVTVEGQVVGDVRGYRSGHRWRLSWRPPGWGHDVTTQVVV